MLHVSGHDVLNLTDATGIDRGVAPGVVSEVRVDRHCDHFNVARLEFGHAVIQSDQLGRADEGEVQWVEEHQAVLALDGRSQVEAVDDFAVAQNSWNGEVRGIFANEYAHAISPDGVESSAQASRR
ncbi:hypothetical protein D3C80_1164350 [compost metagenome]